MCIKIFNYDSKNKNLNNYLEVWFGCKFIGQRKFQSLDEERQKIKDVLAKMEISLAFLSNTYFYSAYNPENWELIKTGTIKQKQLIFLSIAFPTSIIIKNIPSE